MTVRPARLNATVAGLFIIGSALFALGSVPAYVNAVGTTADSVTYFVGSISSRPLHSRNSCKPRHRQ